MNNRKLQALRNLAERPGTESEGKLAREILDRLERKLPEDDSEATRWFWFEKYLRTRDMSDLEKACSFPNYCDCGASYRTPKCENLTLHSKIRSQTVELFPKGTRIYYNRWAYEPNSPGIVMGYPRDAERLWNWMRIKFYSLKSARNVPVYSRSGYHVSIEPVNRPELQK